MDRAVSPQLSPFPRSVPLPSSVRKALKAFRWLAVGLLVSLGASAVLAQTPRSVPYPVALRTRIFTPAAGIDPALPREPPAHGVHLIAQLAEAPDLEDWGAWERAGVHRAAFLHDTTWVIRVDGTPPGRSAEATVGRRVPQEGALHRAFGITRALAFAALLPNDKAPPSVLAGDFEDWALVDGGRRVRVVLAFFTDSEPEAIDTVVSRLPWAEPLDRWHWAVHVDRGAVRSILEEDVVEALEPGPPPERPLMQEARRQAGVEALQQIDTGSEPPLYQGVAGSAVRMSNGEGLNPSHDDFWDHDAAGARTTPRWLGCPNGNGAHGTMTAGIMLGNGFRSGRTDDEGEAVGGTPYAFRGVAPQALFDCYGNRPDVSNHSFTQSHGYGAYTGSWDQRPWDAGAQDFHPHVGAAGNEGSGHQYGSPDDVGYYSLWRVAKNEIVVANVGDDDLRWGGSSIGPTLDGRIKPDLSAPGHRALFPSGLAEVAFELDSVRLYDGATLLQDWHFDGSGSGWTQGWGETPWWAERHVGPITQSSASPGSSALRSSIPQRAGRHGLVGTIFEDDGATRLALTSSPGHRLQIRYRLDAVPRWSEMGAVGKVAWTVVTPGTNDYTDYYAYRERFFDLAASGEWHDVTVDLGSDPEWQTAGDEVIDILVVAPFGGVRRGMASPNLTNGYGPSGGSSAAAPVVTGGVALLLNQLGESFGVVLGDRSPSPFWWDQPGSGVPYPSTFRALLVHGARDLARGPEPGDAKNPDTLEPTRYHGGPDEVTGYGIVDVGESSRVLAAHTASEPRVVERELTSKGPHAYYLQVPAGVMQPLRVTLAWDDPPGSSLTADTKCKLLNDLDLRLIGPDLSVHLPWTLDPPPYHPAPGQTSALEVRPARRDRDNPCDNLERVDVDTPAPGTWTVVVSGKQWAGPQPPQGCRTAGAVSCQRYSLVLGAPPRPADHLHGGKVVFVSDRVDQPGLDGHQLFVREVDASSSPQRITADHFRPRYPEWSPNGAYIAYVTQDVIVGPGATVDVLRIIDEQGTVIRDYYPGDLLGTASVKYQSWSPDGRKIVFTYFDDWEDLALGVLELAAPYDFQNFTVSVLVPPGIGAAEGVFSPDGSEVYFGAHGGELHRVPAGGGVPVPVYGDGRPVTWAFAPSVSPDGTRLLVNSELYREDPQRYLDEEVVEVHLIEGVTRLVTHRAGHQYGTYAVGGGGEYVVQSNAAPGTGNDLFLAENGVAVKLEVGDPDELYDDHSPHWWKAAPPTVAVPPVVGYCAGADAVDIALTLCNGDPDAAHPVRYELAGIPPEGGCGLFGPDRITYLEADPASVAAGACRVVKVRVARPDGMSAHGERACFHVTARDLDTGVAAVTEGAVVDLRLLCAVDPPRNQDVPIWLQRLPPPP